MDTAMVLALSISVGIGIRLALTAETGRAVNLIVAIAALASAYTPGAGSSGPWAEWALWGAIGFVASASPGADRSTAAHEVSRLLVLPVTYFTLAVAVTALRIPAGAVSIVLFAVLALGAAWIMRTMTSTGRRLVCRGIVVFVCAQSLASVYELVILGQPGFWPVSGLGDASKQYTFTNPFLGDTVPRMAGSTGHPIVLGFLTVAGSSLLLAAPRDFGPLALRLVIGGIMLAGLFASGTRNAVVALGAVVMVAILRSGTGRRGWRIALAATVLVLAVAQNLAAISEQIRSLIDSGSYTNRIGSISSAPQLVADRPPLEALFGSGWGSEGRLFERGFLNQNGFGIVDNQLVTALGTFGLVGCALFIAVLARFWRLGDARARSAVLIVTIMSFSLDHMRWAGLVIIFFALMSASSDAVPSSSNGRSLPSVRTVPHRIGVPL